VRFEAIVATSEAVARTSARLEKIAALAELLRQVEPADIETAVAFLSGTTVQGRVGVGYAGIASASDVAPAEDASLTIGDVARVFASVAAMSGAGSAAARQRELRALFSRATAREHDFLRRLVFGELRQGAVEGVLTEAIARAAGLVGARVRRAAMITGDLGHVARLALTEGGDALDRLSVQLMRPVQPMLAESADSIDAALADVDDATIEFKIDGARAQVHKDGDDVRIFTRALNDVTASAPEVVSLVRALPAKQMILDGEIVALQPNGSLHPFQVTMRRFGRTVGVDAARAALPLTPFFFDVLYEDGTALVDEPLDRRVERLTSLAGASAIPRVVRPTAAQAEAFAARARQAGHEGVMVKALASTYEAGRRGAAWIKVKPARTLDLVVLAAEWGSGRRKGWLSNIHLGARDAEHGGFVMLGKTFKGMTDAMLAWQTERFLALEIARDAYTVFVKPELVVEVAFNEIQQSPTYPGGLALRFARVASYRTDKTASEADTIATVRAMAATR
jgi:DNA ligase-1